MSDLVGHSTMASVSTRTRSLVLSGGFIAAGLGILVAHGEPARGYETSIYAATPWLTWALFGIALLLALVAGLFWSTTWQRYLAIGLGSTTMTAIVMLPLIRGYRYLGHADSLTHLGWAKDMLNGVIGPFNLFYPGLHSWALSIASLSGLSLTRAFLVMVGALFVAFLVFVPLTVRAVTEDEDAIILSAIAAWLVMPMNQIATTLLPHTNSLTLLFVPVLIFAFVIYVRRTGSPRVARITTQSGLLLPILGAGLILFHPQHALNVIVLFIAVSMVQLLGGRWRIPEIGSSHRALYVQTGLLMVLFAVWIGTHTVFQRALAATLNGLFSAEVGATSTVAQRGTSLTDIGASLPEVFAKLFLVSAVFGLLVAWFAAAVFTDRVTVRQETRRFVTYLTAGFLPLSAIFLIYFAGTPKMSFRQLGFLYVLVTLASGVAIVHAGSTVTRFRGTDGRTVQFAVVIVLAASLLLTVATMFPSPFIYSASSQVTDQQLAGYELAFDHRDGTVPYAAMRSIVGRYGDSAYGSVANAGTDYDGSGEGFVDAEAFSSGRLEEGYTERPYYLVVTEYDVERQVVVYKELHYTRGGLEALDAQPSVDLAQSNGEVELYVVA